MMAPYVAAVVDPVNADAVGTPDFNTSKTSAQKLTDVFTITGFGPAGGFAAAVVPALVAGYYTQPGINVGGTQVDTWGTATNSDWYAGLASDVYEYRIISGNVTIENISSSATDSGILYVGGYAGSLPATPCTISGLLNDDGIRCPAKNGASFNIRPYANSSFFSTAVSSIPNFPVVVIGVTGIPTTSPSLIVTVTWNVELIYNGQTLGRTNSKQTPCNMMDCCVAANCNTMETTVAAGPDAYGKLKRAGIKIAKFAATAYLRQHGIYI